MYMDMDDTHARYLLGLLPDEEAQRLDEASIADDEFAGQLAATEHDLIDAYLAGDLPEEYRRAVEAVYGASGAGQAQIRFAAALGSQPPVVRSRRPVVYRALAAAAVLVLAVGSYVLLRPAPGRQTAPVGSAQGPSKAPAAPTSTAQTPPAVAPSQPGEPRIPSFVLAAPLRSAPEAPAIAISGAVPAVELRLEIDGDDFPVYGATLKDASGLRPLWRSGPLRAEGRADRRVVRVRMPRNLLTPRRHILELRGVPARGAAQNVGSYAFRVVLE